MKIIISEMMHNSGLSKLQSLGDVEVLPDLWKSKEQLLQKIIGADALIVRNQTIVDEELLRAARNLKVIGRLGVGLDNIDLHTAKQLNVKVVSAKNANSISVAEYVMTVILSASRPLLKANDDVNKGNWNRSLFTGNEIYGKTLGLIGTGEIGHRLAKRAIAFGMNVIGFDPYVRNEDFPFEETGIIKADFHEVLKHGDFISIHTPLTKDTKSLIGIKELKLMKKNGVVINTSRGGIIDEEALFQSVEVGQISGAFLDVLEVEPIKLENQLLKSKKIIITPHIAGLTKESQERISTIISNEVINVLQGRDSLSVVSL
jgi:D-3-phosphoglycerate dehydrogenase/(S)-sulfolactate dehydrogenase